MENSEKKFDLVVFGANAFTGKLALKYIAQNFPREIRWAMAGRNLEKLNLQYSELISTQNPPLSVFSFDHVDKNQVFDVVGQARVVLTFAGPFSRYGENIVAACAQLGTHYLDITGETYWIQKMIEKYETVAQKSGAVLIPFSGFDSIPSDLGVLEVLRQASEPVTEVVSLFSLKGGINGGTFETFLEGLEQHRGKSVYGENTALVPESYKDRLTFKEQSWPRFIKEHEVTAPPFFMAPINSRVVYRSQALRLALGNEKQPPFRYTELQKVSPRFSFVQSWVTVFVGKALSGVGRFSVGRKVLCRLGPQVGVGPSESLQNSGFFKVKFLGYRYGKLVSSAEISFSGDPGNKATVTMACESARCLISDRQRVLAKTGGFWTPSTALGSILKERLIQAGMHFN